MKLLHMLPGRDSGSMSQPQGMPQPGYLGIPGHFLPLLSTARKARLKMLYQLCRAWKRPRLRQKETPFRRGEEKKENIYLSTYQ